MTFDSQTLAHIARGALLPDVLHSLVTGFQVRKPDIRLAVLLPDEEGTRLDFCTAPGLCAEHCAAIKQATDTLLTAVTEDAQTSNLWSCLNEAAQRYALKVRELVPIRSASNHLLGFFVVHSPNASHAADLQQQIFADMTMLASIAIERERAEARIRKAEALLRRETSMALAIEGSGTGIWDRNVVTNQIEYSNGWKALLGYAESEISNHIEESYTRVHPDDLASVQATIQAHFDQKTESYEVEHRIRCKDGSYKWICSRGKVVQRDAAGKPLRMIGTTSDVTAMRALAENLRQSAQLITSLTNEVPGLVYQYRLKPNGDAFFSYASEGIRDIYEITPEQVANDVTAIDRLLHPDDRIRYYDSLQASAASQTPWHLEYRVILPRQGLRWRQANARPRRLEDGSVLWHGFITDVTERKRIEFELEGFATIDFLTQLPNRRYFIQRMEEELARIQRVAGARTAVLMCDLDHFKNINDCYGHAVGDLVLKHFADILRDELRKIDTAGRVGGEEFSVVLGHAGIDEAMIFARRLQKKVAGQPLVNGDATIPFTLSIGVSVMKVTDSCTDAALSRSDIALYRAKENGRNRIEADFS
ncbi:MAG TPA: diguanylate cyclase [Herminiimonas sp.]|jgi:diguanylate cyclase (GGDEF)-like protein/PAS domain S-box-containing protein|nr:diguanylate cyclase [Herminiimonas sp.]